MALVAKMSLLWCVTGEEKKKPVRGVWQQPDVSMEPQFSVLNSSHRCKTRSLQRFDCLL